mgnify:CR=1 FL=1
MKNITRILSAALALCLLAALCLPARADGTQDCGAKLLAITFDDGPGKYTGALLDGLAERGVHATFFVNGINASGWPETLKRIVNEGHQLANHTYNHKNLNTCSAQTVAYEISAVQALITAAGGDENAYIRAPYGNANKTVKSVVTAPLIYWSVDPEDWKYRNAETVRSNIEAGVFDGAIILVHDIYKTSVDGALAAIDDLLAEGYEFVTVKDLFKRRGVTPEAGKVYYDAKNNGINLSAEQISPEYYDEDKLAAHWGYDALCLCMERGWLTTDADGRWLPNHYVTRGALATAFGRFCGITDAYRAGEDTGYADVSSDDPDAPFIRWASDAGLMIGTGGQFSSDATLTREQLATVLARYLTLQGEAEAPALSLAEVYSDADAISGWAADGVARCTELGPLQGSGGAFHPKGTLTRAQLAAILQRLSGK